MERLGFMCTPEDIPEALEAIRDQAIEFTLGQNDQQPEGVDEFYTWLEEEGYGSSDPIDNGIYIQEVSDNFNDEMLSSEEDIDIDKINDQDRVNFAKRLIESAEMLTVEIMPLSNSSGSVVVGFITREMGMHDLGMSCCGLYKNEDDFISELRKSDWFLFLSDMDALTEDEILELWESQSN